MEPEIVGFGHIVYDLRCYVDKFPKPDKTSFVRGRMKGSVGGSAANVISNCAKLGKKAAFLGKIGFDPNGEFVLKRLKNLGVDTSGLAIDAKAETGHNLVLIDKTGEPEVIESLGANEPLPRSKVKFSLIDTCRIVHLTGAPVKRLEDISAYAKSRGKLVSFDPGRAISRLGYKTLQGVLGNADIIMINRKEALQLGGAAKLLSLFRDRTIIIKGGKKPTIVYDPKEGAFAEIGTIPIVPKDTIGAGDAFAAGVLVRLLEGADIRQAVAYGNACGAAKSLHEGADGLPRRKEVDSFHRMHRKELRITRKRRIDLR